MPLVDTIEIFQMTNVGAHIDGTDVYQSNPNLLDNWYFVGGGSQLGNGVFPINQRGQSSYAGGGTAIDRWKTWDGSDTIVLTSTGVKYKSPNGNGIFQYFLVDLPTNTLTFSVKIDGVISSVVLPEGQNEARGYGTGFEFLVNRSNKTVGVISANTELLLQAFKLEVGTVSTLANDAPPKFDDELRHCQNYLWVDTFGSNTIIASGLSFGDSVVLDFVTPVPMAKGTISVTFNASPYLAYETNLLQVPSGTVYVAGMNGNHLRLQIGTNGPNLGSYKHIDLLIGTETTVTVSNEP